MLAYLRVGGQTVPVPPGLPLHVALARAGTPVETPCGARGRCRKCRVQIRGAVPLPTAADQEHLSAGELALGFRLACQHRCIGPMEVRLFPEAPSDGGKARLGRLEALPPVEPWAPLELAPAGTRPCGLALDVGTTTVVAALLDLHSGEELAAAAAPNPQSLYGADLMARLAHAQTGPGAQRELQVLAVRTASELTGRLTRRARLPAEAVVAVAVVGNTAMHHLFLGLPVAELAVAPYRPAVAGEVVVPARSLGLEGVHPEAPVLALPVVAGFVGADALAVALALGLDEPGPPVLAVDIGTNGECLLRAGDRVWAASAPAGPAFEGGELAMGMRAGPGAIVAVDWSPPPPGVAAGDGSPDGWRVEVLPGAPPRGVAGTGLVDAAAALLAAGTLSPDGRLRPQGPLGHRIRQGPWPGVNQPGPGALLAEGEAGPVVLTQQDVRQLQLAKGAIRSGIELLLRSAGLAPEALERVALAGTFGAHLRPQSVLAIGLLPPVPAERVEAVGNAAARGAKLCLLSATYRERAVRLARRIQHLELATHPDFEEVFFAALSFPDPAAQEG